MQKLMTSLLFFLSCFWGQGQTTIQSPNEFLPTDYGKEFTPYYLVSDYVEYAAQKSPKMVYQLYGRSIEKRPLAIAIISSEENIKNLDNIRHNNLKITGLEKGKPDLKSAKSIVWVNYGVHGNEPAATESALQTIYQLISNQYDWLNDVIIIINPCANPDGFDRYVSWNRAVSHKGIMPDIHSLEHREPWPGGRTNHYYFDLNRDWAWATQSETQQLLEIYHQWMPHVIPDMHEQKLNSPFYFAPAAPPFHEYITAFQSDFQYTIGQANARRFDKNDWLYYSREIFDLFYPSYGDTYPIFNGAVGMTFEQAGHSHAGRAVWLKTNDTLFIQERIDHLVAASLETIKTTATHRKQLVNNFKKYFSNSQKNPVGHYQAFVIKGSQHPYRIAQLMTLLNRHHIQYFTPKRQSKGHGFYYQQRKETDFQYQKGDIIIPAKQPMGVLANVLFEPDTQLEDSLTYDVTAWALPYAFGLEAYAVAQKLPPIMALTHPKPISGIQGDGHYAWIADWSDINSAKFLARLLQKGIRVKYNKKPFFRNGKVFHRGSIIITSADNRHQIKTLKETLQTLAIQNQLRLYAIKSGFSKQGPDLGSPSIQLIKKPKIAIVQGKNISPYQYGELWSFMENQIDYPFVSLKIKDLKNSTIWNYNTLVLVDGDYSRLSKSNKNYILGWVKKGGKLILIDSACQAFAGLNILDFDEVYDNFENQPIAPFDTRKRANLSTSLPGGIIQLQMDNTHPLGFGYDDTYFSMKTADISFSLFTSGANVGITNHHPEMIGFFGSQIKSKLSDNMVFGVKKLDAGQVIFLVDDPLFRGIWKNGELLMANALFFAQ